MLPVAGIGLSYSRLSRLLCRLETDGYREAIHSHRRKGHLPFAHRVIAPHDAAKAVSTVESPTISSGGRRLVIVNHRKYRNVSLVGVKASRAGVEV